MVEITGKQFNWIYRYAGKDSTFGKKYFKKIDDAKGNTVGLVWEDNFSHDDLITDKMVVIVGRPVKLIINSRDVIHDVGLPHFRMKMDAVPGTPTTLWFTPKYTTEEMKKKTDNPNFVYEISCDQLCGKSHYSMRGVIEVVTEKEYSEWMAKQKPAYYASFPDLDPANKKTDSLSKATATATTSVKGDGGTTGVKGGK
jgi:cytochrome c oxidase subunit II